MKCYKNGEEKSLRQIDFRYGIPVDFYKSIGYTLTPVDGYWEDVCYYTDDITFDNDNTEEYVYILVNDGMPGICKIGFTTTNAYNRAHEINRATGVITPWYPFYSKSCVNAENVEKEIHKYLEHKQARINYRREGFYISAEEAKNIVIKFIDKTV